MSSSQGATSAPKTSYSYKPVYKFITFEDVTPRSSPKHKGYSEQPKSWREFKKTEMWFDQAKVDREVKDQPLDGYIQSYLSMGKRRREILDNYLKTLNESMDKADEFVGDWQAENLFPGTWVTDKKSGQRIRPPELFWVIIKRMKKVPKLEESKSVSSSAFGSSLPKGVLKDDNRKDTGYHMPGHDRMSSSSDPLVHQLLQALTRLNTKDNLPDVQAQLQQLQFQLAQLTQSQRNHQQQQMPMMNYSGMQAMQAMQYPDQNPQLTHRLPLPVAPMAPGQFNNLPPRRPTETPPPQMMRTQMPLQVGYNDREPYSPHRQNPSGPRPVFDDEDGGYHLNAIEAPDYPRGGTGARRNSTSNTYPSHALNIQDEMMLQQQQQQKYNHRDSMVHIQPYPRMVGSYPNNMHHHHHPHMDNDRVHMVESWRHDESTNSEASEPDYRGRPQSRAESSIYSPNHLLNNRPRSLNRGEVVDLSQGRRNSVNFSGNGMMPGHGGPMRMGKGFESYDSRSEDEDHQRVMMHHGMSIERRDSMTPWPPHR